MESVSQYFADLSAEAKARYTAKVKGAGLQKDPYAIPCNLWVAEPDTVPEVAWSDMFFYMIMTPSAHTREEIKVG